MSINVVCVCGKKLVAKDEQAGMRAKCPTCGKTLKVPPASAQAQKPSAAPVAATVPPTPLPAPSPAASPPTLYQNEPLAHWFGLLKDIDPMQRRKATEVLATVGPEAAADLPSLIERLEADHVLARHWAIVCLAQIGPAARPALENLLDRLADDEPLIRQKAAWAVGVVLPEAQPFTGVLLRDLSDKHPEVRAAAVECFRSDVKTAGISRFRYWACSCGRVAVKSDLEERLRQMAEAPEQVSWQGEIVCHKCRAKYAVRDVYAGKFDVAPKYWSKLRARFGDRLQVPDDFFGAAVSAQKEAVYRVADESQATIPLDDVPSMTPFSAPLLSEAFDEAANNMYKIADEPPPVRPVEILPKTEKKIEKQKR